jgi:hypothetical protein
VCVSVCVSEIDASEDEKFYGEHKSKVNKTVIGGA